MITAVTLFHGAPNTRCWVSSRAEQPLVVGALGG
jgi:hypothetical protein